MSDLDSGLLDTASTNAQVLALVSKIQETTEEIKVLLEELQEHDRR